MEEKKMNQTGKKSAFWLKTASVFAALTGIVPTRRLCISWKDICRRSIALCGALSACPF